MPTFDASTAECLILTFKEGLLSAVAHDLKLRAGAFSVTVDPAGPSVVAVFDATAIRVVNAMRDGAENPGGLSDKDRRDIDANLAKDVLEVRRHREIRFRSTAVAASGAGYQVEGLLAIKGQERPIRFAVTRAGDRHVAEVTLHQPDFGIKPFSALLGTLKIRPDVRVRLSLPAAG